MQGEKQRAHQRAGNRTTKSGCIGCGKDARPAREKNCLTCRGSNHFAGMCRARKVSHSRNHARALEVGLKPKETDVPEETNETKNLQVLLVSIWSIAGPYGNIVTLHLDIKKHFESLKKH